MPKTKNAHPDAPKRFKSSYICFAIAHQEAVKEEIGPNARVADISKRMAQLWKSLGETEKKKWDDAAKADRARYEEEKASYNGPWQLPHRRAKKDPSAPKRPMSAFLYFSQKYRPIVKEQNPDVKNTEISKILGERWRNAPAEERNLYIEQEAAERKKYKVKAAKWKQEQAECVSGDNTFDDKSKKSKKKIKPPKKQIRAKSASQYGPSPLTETDFKEKKLFEGSFTKVNAVDSSPVETDYSYARQMPIGVINKAAQIGPDFSSFTNLGTDLNAATLMGGLNGKTTQAEYDFGVVRQMESEINKAKELEKYLSKTQQVESDIDKVKVTENTLGNVAAASIGGFNPNNLSAAGNGATGLQFSSPGAGVGGYSIANIATAGAGADPYSAGNLYAPISRFGTEGLGSYGIENMPGIQQQALLAMQNQYQAGQAGTYGLRGGTGVDAYDSYGVGNYDLYGGSGSTAASLGIGAAMSGMQTNLGGLGGLQNFVGLSQQGGGISGLGGALQGNGSLGGAFQGNTSLGDALQGNMSLGGAFQGNVSLGGGLQGNVSLGGGLQGNASLESAMQANASYEGALQANASLEGALQGNVSAEGVLQGNASLESALQANGGSSFYGYSPATAQQLLGMMGPSGMSGLGGAGGMGY